jgi:hypothetical protein
MKRRAFVYVSAVATASIVIPSLRCRDRNDVLYTTLKTPRFLSHICDKKALQNIGASYKKQFPEQAKEDALVKNLLTDNTGKPLPENANPATVDAMLDNKIGQEFDTEKTVIVDGWVLSETEARQCALYSIS